MCLFAISKLTQPTLCLPVPIAQCNVEFISARCMPETDTQVYLIEMECTDQSWQVLQWVIFNSLWTNTFVSETPSWCETICAPMITRYCFMYVYMYRYIDKMPGYQIKLWPFPIFDTCLYLQKVLCKILISYCRVVWLLCLNCYINAPVLSIFFDDFFRWFDIDLCCVPLLPFAKCCYFVCTDSATIYF